MNLVYDKKALAEMPEVIKIEKDMIVAITATITKKAVEGLNKVRQANGLSNLSIEGKKFTVEVNFGKMFAGQKEITKTLMGLVISGLSYDSVLKQGAIALFETVENPSSKELDKAAQSAWENKGKSHKGFTLPAEFLADLKSSGIEIPEDLGELKKLYRQQPVAKYPNYGFLAVVSGLLGPEKYGEFKKSFSPERLKAAKKELAEFQKTFLI